MSEKPYVGLVATFGLVVLLEFLRHTVLHVPNPTLVLILAVAYSGFCGGVGVGIISAVISVLYATYYLSVPGSLFSYTDDSLRRVLYAIPELLGMAVMAGFLNRRVLVISREALESTIQQRQELSGELNRRREAETALLQQQQELEMHVADRTEKLTAEIEQRKRFENSLQQSELQKSAILEAALDGIITVDHDGKIIEFNTAAENIFGWTRQQMIGKQLHETIIPGHLRERHRSGFAKFMATGKGAILGKRIEMPALRADGTEFPVELSIVVVHTKGNPVFTGFIRDITERKRSERERAWRLEMETKARHEAEEASRLKDEFLDTISHELRTPLTALMGWIGIFKAGKLNDEKKARALEIIEKAARAEAQLVEQLLEVSDIAAGNLHIQQRPIDFIPLVLKALDSARANAGTRNITISSHIETTSAMVKGDDVRLNQIVANLLANAIKFTPDGGRIDVSLSTLDDLLKLSISDTGVGIPAHFVPHLFERFRQADNTTTRAYGGLGLGLSIVRHLVEAHGGSVQVDSPGINLGTSVTVLLPLLRSTIQSRRTIDLRRGAPADLHGKYILVVEDDPDTCEILAETLRSFGAHVETAGCASEALASLATSRPDVLVSDISMPGEDGYSLLRKLRMRSPEKGGRIPAIALTAYSKPEDRAEALAAGFNLHVAKPVEPEDLSRAVAELAETEGVAT